MIRNTSIVYVVLAVLSASIYVTSTDPTFTSTVYFRRETNGPIVSLDSRDGSITELDGSEGAAGIVSLVIYSPSAHVGRTPRLYWSDHMTIQSAALDGSGLQREIGALVRVQWYGTNFGAKQSDLVELFVKGVLCVSVLQWSPTFVECLVALPDPYSSASIDPYVKESDCSIRTTNGIMTGFVRNGREMRATGYPSPIVDRIEVQVTAVLPHALAIDEDANEAGHGMLYWSNSADGRIYCSSLVNTEIAIVQDNVWGVRGLAVITWPQVAEKPVRKELYMTLESKGELRRVTIAPSSSTSVLIVAGLESPRGIAVDPLNHFLYFTEKTGRIYRLVLNSSTMMATHPQIIVTLPSITRLDGLSVDDKYLYWCESNTNVVARASIDSFQREVLVGGSPDSILSWPRSVALISDKDGTWNDLNDAFYYVEYPGRISKGRTQQLLVNLVATATMRLLDQLIQQSAAASRSGGGHSAAFTRSGGGHYCRRKARTNFVDGVSQVTRTVPSKSR